MLDPHTNIAYLSLEIGLEDHIPTYSGGLGVLAGDTIKAAADLGLPLVAATLLYREGYFEQSLDAAGRQSEAPRPWDFERTLRLMPPRVSVPIEGREVQLRAWRLDVRGVEGHVVPVYYLDTDLPENDGRDRAICRALYAGGTDERIKQEAILGIGGRRILRAIGHDVGSFHMNEGHAVFVTVELLSEHLSRMLTHEIDGDAIARVREKCAFTTHTPVPAGHDRFDIDRVRAIIGEHPVFRRPDLYGEGPLDGRVLHTTRMAMNLSHFTNGVARKHGEVSRAMFPGYRIDSITNGVHAASWACQPMRELFDRYTPGWRRFNDDLRLAMGIPGDALWAAHGTAKRALLERVKEVSGVSLDPEAMTLSYARRATAYKRPTLLLSEPERLRRIAQEVGPIQILYAGKAHPRDGRGKELIEEVHRVAEQLRGEVPVVFLPNYEIGLCRLMVSGSDLWVNTPRPPLEASGTSGMKAALNGVPSLSTLDGWWLEGCVPGVTGWAIGDGSPAPADHDAEVAFDREQARQLCDLLEREIVPVFRGDREGWLHIMRGAISINGSHFTTERMMREYALRAYLT